MNEILVECYVPAVGKAYDVFVPVHAAVAEVTVLLAGAIEKLADGIFRPVNPVLCSRDSGLALEVNKTMGGLKYKDGDKLLLI